MGKIHPMFLLGAMTLSTISKSIEGVPETVITNLTPALLHAANEMLSREKRISAAFNYFLCVGCIYKYVSEEEADILRELGKQLFVVLEITNDEFDHLEDNVIAASQEINKNSEDLNNLLERTLIQIRNFRDINKQVVANFKS